MKNHNSATYYSLTGHAPPLDDIRLRDTQELYPAYGSTVARLQPAGRSGGPVVRLVPARAARRQRHARPARQLPGQGVRPVLHRPGPEPIGLPAPRAEPAVVALARPARGPPRPAAIDRPADRPRDLVGDRPGDRRVLQPGPDDAQLAQGEAGVRPLARARQAPRRLRPDDLRPELPAGPPTGRGRRAVRFGLLLRSRSAARATAAGTRTATTSTSSRSGSCRSPTWPFRP